MKHSSGAQSGAFSKGFRPNMSATWVQLGVNFREDDPNLVPTWAPHAAIWHHMWTCLGGASVKITSRMGQHGEHGPCDTKSSKHANRGICTRVPRYGFLASTKLRTKLCSLCFVYVGPNLVQNCHQTVPSCVTLGLTWTYMCIAWLQLGPKLGLFAGSLGSGPISDSMQDAENLPFCRHF